MAACDLAARRGDPVPMVIVTGGIGARSWTGMNGPISAMLTAAERVDIWGRARSALTPVRMR